MWRYKFNLAVKGFAGYMLFREVQQYRNLNEKTLMTINQGIEGVVSIGAHTALFGTVVMLI